MGQLPLASAGRLQRAPRRAIPLAGSTSLPSLSCHEGVRCHTFSKSGCVAGPQLSATQYVLRDSAELLRTAHASSLETLTLPPYKHPPWSTKLVQTHRDI